MNIEIGTCFHTQLKMASGLIYGANFLFSKDGSSAAKAGNGYGFNSAN